MASIEDVFQSAGWAKKPKTTIVHLLKSLADAGSPHKPRIYASELGYCLKKTTKTIKEGITSPKEAQNMRILDAGNDFEDRYIRYFEKLGLKPETQIAISTDVIGGRIDAIVTIEGERMVVEFKSSSDKSWQYVVKAPWHAHKVQTLLYLYLLKKDNKPLKRGFVFYINKSTEECVEHEVILTPQDEAYIETRLAKLDYAIKNKEVLEAEWGTPACSPNFCPFAAECKAMFDTPSMLAKMKAYQPSSATSPKRRGRKPKVKESGVADET